MGRPVTLFTGQWADLPFEVAAEKAKAFGYDGIELPCWGDHFDVTQATGANAAAYCKSRHEILAKHGLKTHAISNHLVGQGVLDIIDERHKSILPPYVWGDGDPAGVNARAAEEMVSVVNGFTGSSIWHLLYSFPPVLPKQIEQGYALLAERWKPILDVFQENGVKFALEVHPTEIAFDVESAKRTLEALDHHPAFGFNYDPSHLGYQGVDYVQFIYEFSDRIFHVHMKDVYWSPTPKRIGVFGGHTNFGNPERYWDFRSLGHGRIEFEEIIRALNFINYQGPLSVEWEDSGMDREHGAAESAAFVKNIDFKPSSFAFDSNFDK
ncbi:MAG: sugar phosphate isomerase/epimerase [Armatimonadetes bacterium]|nr:sugar phosphate isomerase/epimerase [Armatimonadota bacterium]